MQNRLELKIFNNPDIGGFNIRPAVRVRDNVSATLPTGTSVVIDGISLNNYDRVLFTNLTSPSQNNAAYVLTGVGSGLIWSLAVDLGEDAGGLPAIADQLFIRQGNTYGNMLLAWDGSQWLALNPDLTSGNNSLQIDGTNTPIADISWDNFKITNLGNPTSNLDAANKAYVDTSIGNLPPTLRLDGSNSPSADVNWGTHKISGLGNPTLSQDAATKSYVDSSIAGLPPETDPLSIHKDGSTSPSADISWAAHKITNLANPGSAQDAATKSYVDSSIASLPPETDPLSIHKDGSSSPTANIDWANHKILNLLTPTLSTDAANKGYVDSAIAAIPPSPEVLSIHVDGSNPPTANIPWGGHKLTNLADPTSAQDAATKNYVDTTHPPETDPLSIHASGNQGPIADISWNSHKITSLANPSAAQDAATKSYVDTAISGIVETDPLSIHLDGSTFPSADISWNNKKLIGLATPTSAGDAANKAYVDAQITAIPPESDPLSIHKDGSTSPSADISWASHKITSLANPTLAQDAATKAYVDSSISSHPETDPLSIHLDGSSLPSANIPLNGHKIISLATPTAGTDAANKSYVDAAVAAFVETDPLSLHLDGSNSPSADISWNAHKIVSLANPTSAQDAATKAYVDASILPETDPLSIHKDGSSSPSADISWASHKITNLAAPTASTDAANKGYVDSSIAAVPISLHVDGSNKMNGAISWLADLSFDIGSPDSGTTLLRPRRLYLGPLLSMGDPAGADATSPVLNLFLQTSGNARLNIGATSLQASATEFLMQPAGGGTYSWDAFNHMELPPASILLETMDDNNPAAALGKNQIVAGTFSDYTWGRPYGLHAGTRLSVGADSSVNTQPGGALSVRGPADKVIGQSSANSSMTITAVGTFFRRDVGIGDYIQLQGLSATTGKVTAIASDLSLTVDTAMGDGTLRNILLQVDPLIVSDTAGQIHFKVHRDGNVRVGDRAVLAPNYNTRLASGNTLSATPVIIFNLPLRANSVYLLDAMISAAKSDQSDRGSFKRMVTVYRNGTGPAAIQGSVFNEFSQHSSALDVTWVVSGSAVQLQVTGDAVAQVNWGATINYQEFISG